MQKTCSHEDCPPYWRAAGGQTVNRLQNCFSIYGGQLQPGRHHFNPVVEVDRDGMRRSVKTPDMPDTAPDLAACTRIALGDMAIPSSVLNMRSTQSVASTSETTSARRLYLGNPAVAVIVVVGLSEIVLEAGAYTILFGVTVKVLEKAAEDVAERGKAHCAAHYAACMATSMSKKMGITGDNRDVVYARASAYGMKVHGSPFGAEGFLFSGNVGFQIGSPRKKFTAQAQE